MTSVTTGLIVILVAASVGALAHQTRMRLFPAHTSEDEAERDISEYVTMMVGVFYALIVGLSLVAVWENRDNAEQRVHTEASSLQEVYQLADSLPAPARAKIQADATTYADYVVRTEWPLMDQQKPLGEKGWTLLDNLRSDVSSYTPTTSAQNNVASDAVGQLSTLADARRGREAAAADRMPGLLWVGLILGGVLTVALTFVYGLKQHLSHIAMIMGLTALIGFMMILIFNLDNPFNQGLGASSAAFTDLFPSA
jgi:Protein of unknown function (DUF4239)